MLFYPVDPRQYEELFNVVMTATDDNKKLLNTHFQLLPSKSKYPEYYEVSILIECNQQSEINLIDF